MNILAALTPEQRLIESYADVSTRRLQELRGAIDAVIHRRLGGLAPRPSDLQFFSLNGEKACHIPSFPNYAVTETGRVYSYISGGYMNAHVEENSGITVALRSNGSKRNVQIHRLVAILFLDKPADCNFVVHKDGNKLNNHVTNLRWAKGIEIQARRGVRSDNKTGYRGVTLNANGKFKATVKGEHIGCYTTAEEAAEAYNQRAEKLGFGFRNKLNLSPQDKQMTALKELREIG